MEALWFVGTEKNLSYKEKWPIPDIKTPDDVKIKVAYSGVCGSDFHFMKGEMGKFTPKQDGVILGHEFSGTVVELGEKAKSKLTIGDKVCVNPNYCCGTCDWADEGFPHFCLSNQAFGVQSHGGWAEFCVVPDHVVYKLPSNVSLEQGSLGEPYSCVLRGWYKLGTLPKTHVPVLIQGAGIIGSMFAILLHHHGYKNVTVSEPNDERRKQCSGMGLGFDVVHPQELELKLAGKDADKHGFHLIIDCTGNPKACQKALDYARRGATVSWFGCCPAEKKIPVEPFQIYWKELTIVGSFVNPFCFGETMELLSKLSDSGYLDYKKLGVETYSLADYEVALESLKCGKASKAMFKLPE